MHLGSLYRLCVGVERQSSGTGQPCDREGSPTCAKAHDLATPPPLKLHTYAGILLWVLLGLLLWVVSLLNILIIYIFRVIQGFDLFNMYVGECYRLFIVTIVLSLVSIFVDFSWSLLFVRVSWGFLKCHLWAEGSGPRHNPRPGGLGWKIYTGSYLPGMGQVPASTFHPEGNGFRFTCCLMGLRVFPFFSFLDQGKGIFKTESCTVAQTGLDLCVVHLPLPLPGIVGVNPLPCWDYVSASPACCHHCWFQPSCGSQPRSQITLSQGSPIRHFHCHS